MYKSKWTRKVKGLLLSLVVFIVALVAIGVSTWVTMEAKSVQPGAPLYQYFLGIRFDYGAEATLDIQDNGKVTINHDYGEASTDSSPVYYQEEDRFILAYAMNFVSPFYATEEYAPIFAEFYSENGRVYYENNMVNKEITRGFLFDGSNTYVFLEPMYFKWGGRTQEVSAFSFATVSSKGTVILYDYDTEELTTFSTGTYEVTAENLYKTYSVSLSYDSVKMDDGTQRLLFSAPAYLEEIGS